MAVPVPSSSMRRDAENNCVIADPEAIEPRYGCRYPERYQIPPGKRGRRALSEAFGLTNFGVNLTVLEPGGWSSQRHWHLKQDELIYVLEGELTLITNDGEMVLKAGMVAGFRAGVANGHHFVNRADRPAKYLEIGDRAPGDIVSYADIDLMMRPAPDGHREYTDKSGKPY